jgi:hypothetical protein
MESTRYYIEYYNTVHGYWVRYDRKGEPVPSYPGSCKTVEEARTMKARIAASHERAGRKRELRIVKSVLVTAVVV